MIGIDHDWMYQSLVYGRRCSFFFPIPITPTLAQHLMEVVCVSSAFEPAGTTMPSPAGIVCTQLEVTSLPGTARLLPLTRDRSCYQCILSWLHYHRHITFLYRSIIAVPSEARQGWNIKRREHSIKLREHRNDLQRYSR